MSQISWGNEPERKNMRNGALKDCNFHPFDTSPNHLYIHVEPITDIWPTPRRPLVHDIGNADTKNDTMKKICTVHLPKKTFFIAYNAANVKLLAIIDQ